MGQNGINVSISKKSLDVSLACDFVADPANGAVDIFVGVVRNHHDGKSVTGITYDVHETLAENELMNICREAEGI